MRVFEHVASSSSLLAAGLAAITSFAAGPSALAQGASGTALTGVWRAGSTQIDVAVESWGADCGPRPQSSRSAGGGIVNIEQSAGQLVIHGRGQDIRSDACWSRNPSIKRQTTGFSGGAWTSKCRTAPNDPREEQGTYTLRIAGPDTLTYQDVSRYNWALNQSRCVATFTTVQTLTRRNTKADQQALAAEQAPKPITKPVPQPEASAPEPDEKEKVCTPGAPKKMVVRPRRAEIEVGQRVCFKPRVVDAADCVVPDQTVSWSLSHSKALRGSLNNGCFVAADTAAEAEGDFKVIATLGSIKAEAVVSVHPVDLSALIAKRLGGGALTGFEDSVPLPAAPKSVTRVATRHEPETSSSSPRKMIGIALGVAATVLALAALWLSRRKLPATSLSIPPAPVSSMPPPLPSSRAPNAYTRAETAPTSPLSMPVPAGPARVANVVAEAQPAPSSGPPPGEPWICPTCRVGYPAQQEKCPKDGTALQPYADFARNRKRTEEERKKRCPKCGSVFPSHASFCAEDGTQLVDV